MRRRLGSVLLATALAVGLMVPAQPPQASGAPLLCAASIYNGPSMYGRLIRVSNTWSSPPHQMAQSGLYQWFRWVVLPGGSRYGQWVNANDQSWQFCGYYYV